MALGLSVTLAAQSLPPAVTYDLVYVRASRVAGVVGHWADVFTPMNLQPGSDLMLLHPDGTEEVLVKAALNGAIADPCVSFDGLSVYYSNLPDLASDPTQSVPVQGSDIFRITLATRQIVQLTHQEYTPNAVQTTPRGYGIFNMGACPVSGGRVVFTSNRNGFVPTKPYTPIASQLYVMDEDGSNVTAIAPMTLGAALHPFQLSTGSIAFSTYESQGLRDRRNWGIWSIWPDGREWGPVVSSFAFETALHFATERSDGGLVVEAYYNANNSGFGSFFEIPPATATSAGGCGCRLRQPACSRSRRGRTATIPRHLWRPGLPTIPRRHWSTSRR